MRALVMTEDVVLVSLVESLLREAGIDVHVFDTHASALHGAVGRAPQRVMVPDDQWPRAQRLLVDAELAAWLVD
ncbi:MAG: putative signal transducing protein [Hyphomicrobium sp.]